MKKIITGVGLLGVGILAGYLFGVKTQQKGCCSVQTTSTTPAQAPTIAATLVMIDDTLDDHLYRLIRDNDTIFIVAYETNFPKPGATQTLAKVKGKYASFNPSADATLKRVKTVDTGTTFNSAVLCGYDSLAIKIKKFASGATIKTEGGVMKFTHNTDVLNVPAGRLIYINNEGGAIVVGYVDQNDIGITFANK